jgi:hypothetical protein
VPTVGTARGSDGQHTMEKRMRAHLAAAALSAAALTVGLAGPANAERYGVDDGLDTFHGSDILSMSVLHGDENVRVITHHHGLRRDPRTGSGGRVYFDTDKRDKGPEYVLVGGFTAGTDYVLSETEGFAPDQWGDPVEQGDYVMRISYRNDRVRIVVSRAALGDPDEVRVAVRASGNRTDGTSHGLVDWVGKPRWFTPWLARG